MFVVCLSVCCTDCVSVRFHSFELKMERLTVGEVQFPGTAQYTDVRQEFCNKRLNTEYPRFSAVCILDTDDAVRNRKYFYSVLQEDLLHRLANMLHGSNKLVCTFLPLRDLVHANRIPEDAKLVIHAHERTEPGHERK